MLFLIASTAVLAALWAYAGHYTARTHKSFPPIGEFTDVDGHQIHAKVRKTESADAPVVLIHGASGNLREFETTLVPTLEGEATLISVDRPGHGYSERSQTAHTLGEQARLIAETLQQTTDRPVVLVGHSFGGAVSLRVSLDYPELVKGIVLLAPVSHPWEGDTTWYNRWAANPVLGPPFSRLVTLVGPGMATNGMDNVFKPNPVPDGYADNLGLPLLFRPSNFRANGRDVSALNDELAAQAPRYAELALPVVVFSASKDHVLSPKIHAYALSKAVPNIDLRILPETGHMPHHFHGKEIKEAILSLAKAESGQ